MSILVSISTVILSVFMFVFDYLNRETNFLAILTDIYHHNDKQKFVQQDSIIDDKSIMMAVCNRHIETWTLNNVKFCGTHQEWQKTYDFIKVELARKKNNIKTVKLGLLRGITLAQAKLFVKFLGEHV